MYVPELPCEKMFTSLNSNLKFSKTNMRYYDGKLNHHYRELSNNSMGPNCHTREIEYDACTLSKMKSVVIRVITPIKLFKIPPSKIGV